MNPYEAITFEALMDPNGSNLDVFEKVIDHRMERLALEEMRGTEEDITQWMAEEWPLCPELQQVILERLLIKEAASGGIVGEYKISHMKDEKGESRFMFERRFT
jgi:hypothetical protein